MNLLQVHFRIQVNLRKENQKNKPFFVLSLKVEANTCFLAIKKPII